MNHKLLVLATVLLLVIWGNARLFTEEYQFHALRRNKGWTFLDRIKLGQGFAQVRFNVKMLLKSGQTTKTYPIELHMVPESLWASQQLMKCTQEGTGGIEAGVNQAQGRRKVFAGSLSPDNNYQYGTLQVISIPQTQTYHFILKDCQKLLTSDYFSRQSKLGIQLQIKNNDRDYGQDEGGNFYWFPLLIAVTAVLIYVVHKSFIAKKFELEETDYIKVMISSCLWMNLISLVFKYIGYLIYFYAGNDFSFFDFVYLFFHALADSIIISILLFVSYGWTVTFVKTSDFDLYVPLGNLLIVYMLVCMMGLITVILTLLNKITDGAHDKYHMYDTIPSYLLAFFKLLTIIIFLVGCIKTIYTAKDNKIKFFMYEVLIIGSFYILTVPAVMLIVEYIPTSQRKQWVFILIELAKTFVIFLLAYMISYKKSGYRSLALGSQSFMQVGNRIL